MLKWRISATRDRPLDESSQVSPEDPKIGVSQEQSQSPLFTKLPPELRLQIYEHVLGTEREYLFGYSTSWVTPPPEAPDSDSPLPTVATKVARHKDSKSDAPRTPLEPTKGDSGPGLNLLRTCRAVYLEAIQILYTKNWFGNAAGLPVHRLGTCLAPLRKDAITSLRVEWVMDSGAHLYTGRDARAIDVMRASCTALVGDVLKSFPQVRRLQLRGSAFANSTMHVKHWSREAEQMLSEVVRELGKPLDSLEVYVRLCMEKPNWVYLFCRVDAAGKIEYENGKPDVSDFFKRKTLIQPKARLSHVPGPMLLT